MAMAANAVGNEELKAKFEAALGKLERQSSVVFVRHILFHPDSHDG
jgi:hypothetical protein